MLCVDNWSCSLQAALLLKSQVQAILHEVEPDTDSDVIDIIGQTVEK